MTNQQLWQAILGNLELTLSKANFTTWFKSTSIIEKSESGIVVGVPNAFTKEWLQNKYHQEIIKALKTISPETKEVKYQIVSPTYTQPAASTKEVARTPNSRRPENQNLNPKYTFETFIVGQNNQLAHAASLAVSKKSRFVLVSSTEVFHGAVTQTSLYKYFKGSQNITQTNFSIF